MSSRPGRTWRMLDSTNQSGPRKSIRSSPRRRTWALRVCCVLSAARWSELFREQVAISCAMHPVGHLRKGNVVVVGEVDPENQARLRRGRATRELPAGRTISDPCIPSGGLLAICRAKPSQTSAGDAPNRTSLGNCPWEIVGQTDRPGVLVSQSTRHLGGRLAVFHVRRILMSRTSLRGSDRRACGSLAPDVRKT
jgi:hypothetical protein